jgi:predicted nucleic acid-binding protein
MNEATRATAFLDASVLYSAPIRDFLIHLAVRDLYQARWSDRVHEEWIAALLRNRRDLTTAQLQRTRRLMEDNIDDALVSGYEHIIDQLTLPDPDDRHVLAAAIHGDANLIVTMNLRDFPIDALEPRGITALHPDAFIGRLLENEPDQVIAALCQLHLDLKHPSLSMDELLGGFARVGLVEVVAELRRRGET